MATKRKWRKTNFVNPFLTKNGGEKKERCIFNKNKFKTVKIQTKFFMNVVFSSVKSVSFNLKKKALKAVSKKLGFESKTVWFETIKLTIKINQNELRNLGKVSSNTVIFETLKPLKKVQEGSDLIHTLKS